MTLSHAPPAVCLSLLLTSSLMAAPTLTPDATGMTNAKDNATINFTMSNLGTKKLANANWVDSITVAGVAIPATQYFASNKGLTGKFMLMTVLVPVGKSKVVISLNLNDGTKLTGEAEVDFQKLIGCSCHNLRALVAALHRRVPPVKRNHPHVSQKMNHECCRVSAILANEWPRAADIFY